MRHSTTCVLQPLYPSLLLFLTAIQKSNAHVVFLEKEAALGCVVLYCFIK